LTDTDFFLMHLCLYPLQSAYLFWQSCFQVFASVDRESFACQHFKYHHLYEAYSEITSLAVPFVICMIMFYFCIL